MSVIVRLTPSVRAVVVVVVGRRRRLAASICESICHAWGCGGHFVVHPPRARHVRFTPRSILDAPAAKSHWGAVGSPERRGPTAKHGALAISEALEIAAAPCFAVGSRLSGLPSAVLGPPWSTKCERARTERLDGGLEMSSG